MPGQRKAWNLIAPQWNRFRKKPIGEVAYFLSFVRDMRDSHGKRLVIDIGGGNGRNCSLLEKAGFSCVNADISHEMCRFYGNSVQADMESLPFADGSFDVVLSINAVQCSENPVRAASEAFRVLKSGGLALFSTWDRLSRRFFPFQWLTGKAIVPWRIGDETVHRKYWLFSRRQFSRLLERQGFSILEEFKGWDYRESWFFVTEKI